jgi:hypothetical protein
MRRPHHLEHAFASAETTSEESAMAGKAVSTLVRVLNLYGPPILKTKAFDHYDKDGKAVMGSRLQTAGQGGPDDAHNTGRALDIIIYAWAPPTFTRISPEREIGYKLIDAFLQAQDDMKWNLLIYDQEQWDENGASSLRISKAGTTGMARVNYEHLSHIHIQWASADREFDEYEDALISWIENPYR